jgi:DNA-directed RNA polymerase subunit RPC12/RpoP
MRILTRDEAKEIVRTAEKEKKCPNCGSSGNSDVDNAWSTVDADSFQGSSCWECDYAIKLVIEGDGVAYVEHTPRKMLRTKEEALEWLKLSPDNALGLCDCDESIFTEHFRAEDDLDDDETNDFIKPYTIYKAKKHYRELKSWLDTDSSKAACPYCRAEMEDDIESWEDDEGNECWRCGQKYSIKVERNVTFSQLNKK